MQTLSSSSQCNPAGIRSAIIRAALEDERGISVMRLKKQLENLLESDDDLDRAIDLLVNDEIVKVNRRGNVVIATPERLVSGSVSAASAGFGFLSREDGGADVFLPTEEMRSLMHGDRILAMITEEDGRGRLAGKLLAVVKRAHAALVGTVVSEADTGLFVRPSNKKILCDFFVQHDKKAVMKAKVGDVVMIEIIDYPGDEFVPTGQVTEVVGHEEDDGIEIEIALRNHELPHEFSKAALDECALVSNEVLPEHCSGRRDLTSLPLVTIDGETAKDFDDAVYCEKAGQNWRLVVAIADVSHYVRPGSALNEDAFSRGTSVYFPRRVIPMLPEKLSNGICSLNPDVLRLAMVCDALVSKSGEIVSYEFYPAVFKSHARLTYTQVWSWISGEEKPSSKTHRDLMPFLNNLYHLFKCLLGARAGRGAIDFEGGEATMSFDECGKINGVAQVVRNDAHRLIEECMLVANVCAADFIQQNERDCLYRVHNGPTPERLTSLRTVLAEAGLQLGGGDNPTAKDYAALVEEVKERPDASIFQMILLRSLSRAQYHNENSGHFGLSYEHYTHFTSPIRRYPDLLVHRAIKAILAGDQYEPGDWEEIGQHCSMTERRADDASREVENWLKCYFMKDRVGEEFEAQVSSVTQFGVFVSLDDLYIDGLIRVADLGNDYFTFNKTKQEMMGSRTGLRYRLGDKVRVRLDRVDMEEAQITFVLASVPVKSSKSAFSRSQPWKK